MTRTSSSSARSGLSSLPENYQVPGAIFNLFVSPRDFTRSMSKNAITHFFEAGDLRCLLGPPALIQLTKVNPHEIRAVSTSSRFKYNMDQVALLKCAYWRSNSVFCSRYLRVPASTSLDVSASGPLIVAQGVVRHLD